MSSRLRVIFFGSPDFAVPSLQALVPQHDVVLVVTQPDRPAGRGMKMGLPPVKETALAMGLPVVQPLILKDGALAATTQALAPDVFVVVAYGRILPPALLAVPRLGPFNVHASLLPKYRGAAPIQWAVIRGEVETGVAIMGMEAGLDTGPVVAMERMPIRDDDTSGTLFPKLAQLGASLLAATLPRIGAGDAAREPQDHTRATLAPLLSKEDGHLDFDLSARLVSARARGVDPWPGAFAWLPPTDGNPEQALKLFRPLVVEGRGRPGQVLASQDETLHVACADGAVAFRELQLPGRKRLPAQAVLAGHAIAPGTQLG